MSARLFSSDDKETSHRAIFHRKMIMNKKKTARYIYGRRW